MEWYLRQALVLASGIHNVDKERHVMAQCCLPLSFFLENHVVGVLLLVRIGQEEKGDAA